MATTTNYSWTTPDDTDLVKDGAAAIRSLGTAIDTTVFTNAGAAIAKSLVDAKGDIIAATADDTVDRLAVGANDTVLIADSSTATGLKWGSVSSKVVQIVSATDSTQTTSTSATYADTGLSVSITPTSASNKVLIFVTQNGIAKNTSDNGVGLRLLRGATTIAQIGTEIARENGGTSISATGSIVYLDSPATTSATTYKTTFNNNDPSGTVFTEISSEVSSIVAMEVTP